MFRTSMLANSEAFDRTSDDCHNLIDSFDTNIIAPCDDDTHSSCGHRANDDHGLEWT